MRTILLTNLALFLVFVFLNTEKAVARQPVSHMKILIMPEANLDQTSQNFSKKVLPKSLTAADSSQSVVSKIIDNSLAYWWDNSELKKTSVGQAATKIEQNMKAEVDFGKTEKSSGHKLSFKLLAIQALAKIEYKGWIKAALNYDAKAAKAEAELLENLSNNKDLVISHSMTSNENKSQLSLRWNW